MLAIIFVNDGTGDEIVGHYRWKVMVNSKVLAEGRLCDHNRLSGWQGLIQYFAETLKEGKSSRQKKKGAEE